MPVRASLLLVIALAGCGGPASSSVDPVAPTPTALPSADAREVVVEVPSLI